MITDVPHNAVSKERFPWKEVAVDMEIIRTIEKEQMKKDIPKFNVGDTVRVFVI